MTRPESQRIPRDQVDQVVKAVYDAADRLGWEHLPASARTRQYDEWVTEPDIGGVLTRYISAESARSWIKDGPMKEYGRARLGAGRYARFGESNGPMPARLVEHALGASATVVQDSVGVKPFHCIAELDDERTYVAWDSGKNFRHLVWASLNFLADHPTSNACIIVLETLEHPSTSTEKARHTAIAERCALTVKYFRTAASKSSTKGDPL